MRGKKKDYQSLYNTLQKYVGLLLNDSDINTLDVIEGKIFTCGLVEDYGWKIPDYIAGNENWFQISNEISAGTFGGNTNRSISWEDDGLAPEGEFLLSVRFCTGAYFFGQDYDTKFFKEFWAELEGYGPKYKDSRNNSMYFTKESAGKFLQDYDGIVDKYRVKYKEGANKRKAAKLRDELRQLEG